MDNDNVDLLTLIGSSIRNLSECIELFDAAKQASGMRKLTSVLADIEAYLEGIDTDPIIRVSSVDHAEVVSLLRGIETDLSTIVSELGDHDQKPIN
jgi:hypothetical protein